MSDGGNEFEWSEDNQACVATYKVLESDHFLDQFEDADLPFAQAGVVKLGTLRYYPKTTAKPEIIEIVSLEIARKFLTFVTKIFTVKKQDRKVSTFEIIDDLAKIFADKNKTIAQLAAVVDENVKFPQEEGGEN